MRQRGILLVPREKGRVRNGSNIPNEFVRSVSTWHSVTEICSVDIMFFFVFVEKRKDTFYFIFKGRLCQCKEMDKVLFWMSQVLWCGMCVCMVRSKNIKSVWIWRNIDNRVESDNTFYLILFFLWHYK